MPLPFLAGLLLAASTAAAAPITPETAAERLHRKGVHCMDVIERPKCAIEKFEALLAEDTRQRELLTDGLLRLIDLYEDADREEDIPPLLRRFWDAGGSSRRSTGHLPFSARFMPSTLNVLINIDPPRVLASDLIARGGPDLQDYLFTCDEVLRHDIEIRHRWQRAAVKAAAEGRQTWQVFYEGIDRDRERRERYNARQEAKPQPERERPPLLLSLSCPLGLALGLRDTSQWRRMTGAGHHSDQDLAVAIFQVDGLEARLDEALKAGRLLDAGGGRFRLPAFEYGDRTIVITSLDRDELVAAPEELLGPMQQARRKRRREMNRELERLAAKVPRDTGAFMVMNQAALQAVGFRKVKRKALRNMLQAVLPRPTGLQVAAVVGTTVGLFTRVPTDHAVRGRMLVNLANAYVTRGADPESSRWLEDLDIAEATDRRALLASYVLTMARLEEILWD